MNFTFVFIGYWTNTSGFTPVKLIINYILKIFRAFISINLNYIRYKILIPGFYNFFHV